MTPCITTEYSILGLGVTTHGSPKHPVGIATPNACTEYIWYLTLYLSSPLSPCKATSHPCDVEGLKLIHLEKLNLVPDI